MRVKIRASRAVAAATVGVATAIALNPAATAPASAAHERRPAPLASADGRPPWSHSRVAAPPPPGTSSRQDVTTALRGRLDGMRTSVGQRLHGVLADLTQRLAAALPPGVAPPDLRDPSGFGGTRPAATSSETLPGTPSVTSPTDFGTPQPTSSPSDAANRPTLELRRVADRVEAKPGDTVTHTVTVRNTGGAEAKPAIVRNALPAGVKPVDSKPSHGEFDTATGVWKTGGIKAGSQVALILVLQVPQGAAGSEMIARSSFVSAPGAKPVIGNACSDDAQAACASTRVGESA